MRRVAITGLGVLSPNGNGVKSFWQNTRQGVSGIERITSFDPSGLSCQIAGEVKNFDPIYYFDKKELKKLPRAVPLAIGAATEALSDAGIDPKKFNESEAESLGVIIGSGGAGFDYSEKQFELFFSDKKRRLECLCT